MTPQERADKMLERICGTKPQDPQSGTRKRVIDATGLAKKRGSEASLEPEPTRKVRSAQASKAPKRETERKRNERRLADQ